MLKRVQRHRPLRCICVGLVVHGLVAATVQPALAAQTSQPAPHPRVSLEARPAPAPGRSAEHADFLAGFRGLPIAFEANHGQVDPEVELLARRPGHTLFLTPTEAVISLHGGEQANEDSAEAPAVVALAVEGANPGTEVVGVDPLPGRVNYFIGDDPAEWRTDIPTFARAQYSNVYPGIDLVYYGRDGLLEFDFVVAPGADPHQIRLNVRGHDSATSQPDGTLVLATSAGELRLRAPTIYQDGPAGRQVVAGRYLLEPAGRVGFEIAEFDRDLPLVIDPQLVYGTFLGGTGTRTEQGQGVAVDSKGAPYIVGDTETANFPTARARQTRLPGSSAAFVTKLNAMGTAMVYSTYLGGSGFDGATAVAVTPAGIAYIVGSTSSRDFPLNRAIQSTNRGSNDGFIASLSANGSTLRFGTYLGGTNGDTPLGIEIGTGPKLGNKIYVFGTTSSRNFPLTNPAQRQYAGGSRDGFLCIVSTRSFAVVHCTYAGTPQDDLPTSLGLNPQRGDLYLAAVRPDSPEGPYVAHIVDEIVRIVAILDVLAGQVLLDPSKIFFFVVVIAGLVQIVLERCVPLAPATTCRESGSLHVLSPDLVLQRSLNFGGTTCCGFISVTDIAADNQGSIYITGDTNRDDIGVVSPFQANRRGSSEGFVIRFAPGGTAVTMASFLGGTTFDFPSGIAVDRNGNMWVAGTTLSGDFTTTRSAIQPNLHGRIDVFAVKISP